MSTAANRNFGLAQRERERRLAMSLDDPGGIMAVSGDPGWDAFWGSLHEKEANANAAGYGFRADLSGIGRDGGDPGFSLGRLTPQERAGIAGNIALGNYTDQQNARKFAQRGAELGRMDQIAEDLQQGEDVSQLDKAASAADAETDPAKRRERFLAAIPGHLRLGVEAKMNAMDLQRESLDLKRQHEERLATGNDGHSASSGDIDAAVQGMIDGTNPPQLPGKASKDYTAILAAAQRKGYNLQSAVTDWNATQKHVASLNGAQQLRLNQAVNQLPELLDSVEGLAKQWKGGKFPILNKANLALAKNGALGPEAASIATRLDAQIADVNGDLATVYMGGNSPTDHGLALAAKSLQGDWDERVLLDAINMGRQNVKIRRNSINNTGVAGASAGNPYGARPSAAPTAPPMAAPAGAPGRQRQQIGKYQVEIH